MKKQSRVSRLGAGIFAAATMAVIALQGGVAQANDLAVWQENYGAQLSAGDSTQTATPDVEWKYVSVRRF